MRAIAFAGTLMLAACFASADYVWESYGGHQYALTQTHGSWFEARDEVGAAGGYLVTINDANENAWLAEFIKDTYDRSGNHNIAWIGLQGLIGQLTWVNGEQLTYTNLYGPGPYNHDHWYMLGNRTSYPGEWDSNPYHDDNWDYQPRGIIEVPEPATMSLLGLGALAMQRRRRAWCLSRFATLKVPPLGGGLD